MAEGPIRIQLRQQAEAAAATKAAAAKEAAPQDALTAEVRDRYGPPPAEVERHADWETFSRLRRGRLVLLTTRAADGEHRSLTRDFPDTAVRFDTTTPDLFFGSEASVVQEGGRYRVRAEAGGVRVDLAVGGDNGTHIELVAPGPVVASADTRRLGQVIRNLNSVSTGAGAGKPRKCPCARCTVGSLPAHECAGPGPKRSARPLEGAPFHPAGGRWFGGVAAGA